MKIVTLKLTDEETDLLDGLVVATGTRSRSDCIRLCMTTRAMHHCQLDYQMSRATRSREGITSRRRKIRDPKPRPPKSTQPPPEMRTLADVLGL